MNVPRRTDGGGERPRPRSLGRFVLDRPESLALLVGLVVLRLLAVAGSIPLRYYDSAEYTGTIDLSGRGRRTWPVPLFFRLVPGDDRWVMWTQAILGAVAFWLVAVVLWASCRNRRVGAGVALTVALLGLTINVTNWDSTILSEPLTIALTLVLVAGLIEFVRRPAWPVVGAVLAVAVPWYALRQNHVMLGVLVALLVGVWAWRQRRDRVAVRLTGALAAGLLVLGAFSWVMFSRNAEIVHQNLTTVVAGRVMTDPGRKQWFVDHGMPLPVSGDVGYQGLTDDAAFQRWVAADGTSTYARYLATHPWYAIGGPLADLTGPRDSYQRVPVPHAAMLSTSDQYGVSRQILPATIEDLLYNPGTKVTVSQSPDPDGNPLPDQVITLPDTGSIVLALVASTFFAAWSWRRFRAPSLAALAVVAVSFVAIVVSWHASTAEVNRHAFVAALTLRIGLIAMVGLLIDRWLVERATGASRPPSRLRSAIVAAAASGSPPDAATDAPTPTADADADATDATDDDDGDRDAAIDATSRPGADPDA